MRKHQLANRFRARHTSNGYSIEYSNDRNTWTMYTPYAYYYDDLSSPEDLTLKQLIQYRALIILNAIK